LRIIIKGKGEFRIGQWKTRSELEAMVKKWREFFMPPVTLSQMAQNLNGKRSKYERNLVIQIGMTWWHGGAYFLYKTLNGDLKDYYYVSGDITGLDKHISDWLLLLYCCNVYPYFNWGKMNDEEKKFLEKLIEYWAVNVCCKLACHIGGFWRFMMGYMASGGKETSSGNSWIMAFIFYCYCEHMKTMYPHLAALIHIFLIERFIAIVVYGDDHIWGSPGRLSRWLNEKSWKSFLAVYFRMTLRDERIYRSLLSVPDGRGRLLVEGPPFLKIFYRKQRSKVCTYITL